MNDFKIIIGPAKKLNMNAIARKKQSPKFINKAESIFKNYLSPLSIDEIEQKYNISQKLAKQVYEMHANHYKKEYFAIELFDGLVYKQLQLEMYDKNWVNKHLIIIDPLYGVIKPYDTIGLYRLDMSTKIDINLKEFWKEEIEKELKGFKVINLASKEWTKWLEKINLIDPKLDKTIKQIKVARGKRLNKILIKKNLI